MNIFCRECGKEIKNDAKFCASCGTEVKISSEKNTSTPKPVITTPVTNSAENKTGSIIKCGNCSYEGPGEPARSIAAMILAWLCVFFAPLITIIYFVATNKYRCPKCKSTFVGIKNKEGVFAGQRKGAKSPVMILVWILLGIALVGIMSSIILVSLNSARQKGIEAQQYSQNQNY